MIMTAILLRTCTGAHAHNRNALKLKDFGAETSLNEGLNVKEGAFRAQTTGKNKSHEFII